MPTNQKDADDTVSTQLSIKSGSMLETESSNKKKNVGQKKVAKTWMEMCRIWPYQSFFIVVMELSFTLTALNNVFNLYYINVLGFEPETVVIILNINSIIAGFFRVVGSSVSDGYLGKFRAIFYGSIVYIFGKCIITFSSFLPTGFPHPWLDFAAVLIIMIGTSVMSPSISPFGGDQFEPHQEKMISIYYSIFYATINIGGVVSNIVMPILRARPCFGKDSCYPLTFSVSTAGVICSFLIFTAGSRWYIKFPPKGGNIFTAIYEVFMTSKANKSRSKKGKYDQMLDYYFDTHNCEEDKKCQALRKKEENPSLCQKQEFIEDFRALKRLLIVFIPMPMFWALYDQQYTVWMNQALLLDGRIFGDFRLLPDQMQVVNPIMIIVLIFIFQSGIYPCMERVVRLTPLRKMVAGGFIAALAFVVSGFVQLKINPTLPDIPEYNHGFVSFVNSVQNAKCELNITYLGSPKFSRMVPANSSLVADKLQNRNELFDVKMGTNKWQIEWKNKLTGCPILHQTTLEFNIQNVSSIILVGQSGNALMSPADTKKPTGGTGQFKIGVVMALDSKGYSGNLALCRVGQQCNQHSGKDFYAFVDKEGKPVQKEIKYGSGTATQYPYIEVRPGSWDLYKLHNDPTKIREEELKITRIGEIRFDMEEQGGIYTLFVTGEGNGTATVHQVVPPNSVSILWQLPQILVISIAEILMSITGLEFAYSQSGPSMKAVAHACWSVTVSIGSLLIIIITVLPFENLALKAFICAGAMVLDVLLLAYLAIFKYEYRKGTIEGEDDDGSSNNESMGKGKENGVQFTKSSKRKSSSTSTKTDELPPIAYAMNDGKDFGEI